MNQKRNTADDWKVETVWTMSGLSVTTKKLVGGNKMNVYGNTVRLIQEVIGMRDSTQFRAMEEMLTSVNSDVDISSSIEEVLTALRELEEVSFHCNEFIDSSN